MNKKILGLLAATFFIGPVAAFATPFNIALTEDGLGDAGADWFGTFDAPDAGGLVTNLNISIHGVTYSMTPALYPGLTLEGTGIFAGLVRGFASAAPITSTPTTVLQMDYFGFNGEILNMWALSPCSTQICGGGFGRPFLGTAVITRATSVPEPGTLALLGLGLVGLGIGRKRKP